MLMVVSSSLVISSKVKPYWKPEHPPPCTKTRSFNSGFPSSAIKSATLAAALSVKTIGTGMSRSEVWAKALMCNSEKSGYAQIVQQKGRELSRGSMSLGTGGLKGPPGSPHHAQALFAASFRACFSSGSKGVRRPSMSAPSCISSAP